MVSFTVPTRYLLGVIKKHGMIYQDSRSPGRSLNPDLPNTNNVSVAWAIKFLLGRKTLKNIDGLRFT